jgi:nitroimidazol reductase NimA-like FMN-containing flavoprotein (pyridoxamine 5'-phosphate oxidase superfamily)
MRRKEKEINDFNLIEEIIAKADICRLALSENNIPYIVPVNFGYKDRLIYFHSSCEGRKLDMLKSNPNVCVQFDADISTVKTENICQWSTKYKSVIAFGKATLVNDENEKQLALNLLVSHLNELHDPTTIFPLNPNLCIIKVEFDQISGKMSD